MFETERLIVRKWRPEDAADVLEMYTHPEVLRFLPRRADDEATLEAQQSRLSKANAHYADLDDGTGYWAVEEKASGKVIGASILKKLPTIDDVEVGWHQNPAFWGKGYATEAARGALKYGFDTLNLQRIVAVVVPDNARSIAVTQRLGMRHEGMVKEYDLDLNFYVLEGLHV